MLNVNQYYAKWGNQKKVKKIYLGMDVTLTKSHTMYSEYYPIIENGNKFKQPIWDMLLACFTHRH